MPPVYHRRHEVTSYRTGVLFHLVFTILNLTYVLSSLSICPTDLIVDIPEKPDLVLRLSPPVIVLASGGKT